VVGYVEGRDLNKGNVDVVVTDGFTGNVMLKTAEGVFRFVTAEIRAAYEAGSLFEKVGGGLSQSVFERVKKKLDPREFGAAPLLGLAKPAFIAHGSSDAYAIRRGIGAVRTYARNDLQRHMSAALAAASPAFDTPAAADLTAKV
jgi:glycerol-3-phosphate acyltransferase PlsX